MSEPNFDQQNYQAHLDITGEADPVPAFKKRLVFVNDSNGSQNYQNCTVMFDSNNFAGADWQNWQQGFILLPLVAQLNAGAATTKGGVTYSPGTALTEASVTDFVLALKNCNTSLVNHCAIEWNNKEVVNGIVNINMYNAFRAHTEYSHAEAELYGGLKGYCKDKSDSWSYEKTPGPRGVGLCNNANGYDERAFLNTMNTSVFNDGMATRQKRWARRLNKTAGAAGAQTDGKEVLFGSDAQQFYKEMGINYIETTAGATYIYYNCIIRLTDLAPQFFKSVDFPKFLKNVNFKITLQVNQPFFRFARLTDISAGESLTWFNDSMILQGSGTNPLMVAAVSSRYNTLDVPAAAPAAAGNTTIVPCGSSRLATGVYEASLCVVRTFHTHIVDTKTSHYITQCRLYCPTYSLNATMEKTLYDIPDSLKIIRYDRIFYRVITNVKSSFSCEITTGGTRGAKRLIICPVLGEYANASEVPHATSWSIRSPFSTSGSTVDPIVIKDFNCHVGSSPVYQNGPINYSFENFLTEMRYIGGRNGNYDERDAVGLITHEDWRNGCYGYYVVDLTRRTEAEVAARPAQSIAISGKVISGKEYDFHCFIEYEADPIQYDFYGHMKYASSTTPLTPA